MDPFSRLRDQFFDQRFALDEEGCRRRAEWFRELGASEADIQAALAGQVSRGMTFGRAHADDVARLVGRVLFRQGAEAITLKISRWPQDEAGHIDITVLEVGQPEQPDVEPPTGANGDHAA